MSVLHAREISSVQDLDSRYLYHHHGSTQHVTRVVTPESHPIHLNLLGGYRRSGGIYTLSLSIGHLYPKLHYPCMHFNLSNEDTSLFLLSHWCLYYCSRMGHTNLRSFGQSQYISTGLNWDTQYCFNQEHLQHSTLQCPNVYAIISHRPRTQMNGWSHLNVYTINT